jgi:hypothetical protein
MSAAALADDKQCRDIICTVLFLRSRCSWRKDGEMKGALSDRLLDRISDKRSSVSVSNVHPFVSVLIALRRSHHRIFLVGSSCYLKAKMLYETMIYGDMLNAVSPDTFTVMLVQ